MNYSGCESRCGIYLGVEDDKVALLKKIMDATDAKIVLSSTWRLGFDNKGHKLEGHVDYLRDKLGKYGLEIYDKTEQLTRSGDLRGKEINEWLNQHPKVDQWVVLDDEWFSDFYLYDIPEHIVRTSFYLNGLTEEDVEQAINILNGELNNDAE